MKKSKKTNLHYMAWKAFQYKTNYFGLNFGYPLSKDSIYMYVGCYEHLIGHTRYTRVFQAKYSSRIKVKIWQNFTLSAIWFKSLSIWINYGLWWSGAFFSLSFRRVSHIKFHFSYFYSSGMMMPRGIILPLYLWSKISENIAIKKSRIHFIICENKPTPISPRKWSASGANIS